MSILEKTNYLNKDINFLLNTRIYEYDMSDGGFSLIKEYKLLPQKTIAYIEENLQDKKEKNIFIGRLCKSEKGLAAELINSFKKKRLEFADVNNLNDDDILSIKKDAIFVISKNCKETKFGNVKFNLKNKYSSYYYINGVEFYLGRDKLDTKNLSKDTKDYQKDFFLNDLYKLMKLKEGNNFDLFYKKLKKYRNSYLNKELPIETYREMNNDNLFRLSSNIFISDKIGVKYIDNLDNLNISYNYIKFLLEFINYSL